MNKLTAYQNRQVIKDEALGGSGTLAWALKEQEFWMLYGYENHLEIPMCLPLILRPQLRLELRTWVKEFLAAVPVGADLSLFWPKYALWLLTDRGYGILSDDYDGITVGRIKALASLHQQWLNGLRPPLEVWLEASKIITELDIYEKKASRYAADAYCYGAYTFGAYWAWKGDLVACERYVVDQRSHWGWVEDVLRGDIHGRVVRETFLAILREAKVG